MTSLSKNGLKRTFLVLFKFKGKITNMPTEIAKQVSEGKLSEKGVVIKGAGMDMSLALWMNIARKLICYEEAYTNCKKNSLDFNRGYVSMDEFLRYSPEAKKVFDFSFET